MAKLCIVHCFKLPYIEIMVLSHSRRNKHEEVLQLGRDDKKGTSNNAKSLPQTPKNQKIKPGDMKEEVAREFADLKKKVQATKRKN